MLKCASYHSDTEPHSKTLSPTGHWFDAQTGISI